MTTYHIAPMSPLILGLTIMMLAILVFFLSAGFLGYPAMFIPGILLLVLYTWVWVRFRPNRFVIHADILQIIWPLKRQQIPRSDITDIRIMNGKGLREEAGWCLRIGAGGLWGAFGWLWTSQRGIVQMYISRTDELIWIERGRDRPWLITPEKPEVFVNELSSKQEPGS